MNGFVEILLKFIAMPKYGINLQYSKVKYVYINLINCNLKVYDKIINDDIEAKCVELCPLECESITYNVNAFFAQYPSRNYANALAQNPTIQTKFTTNNVTYESLKSNMAQLSVYYGDLGYEKYDEIEDMSWIDLISSIGGTLGLFLGMSFLSFVELVDVVLQILFYSNKSNRVESNEEK